MTDKTECAQFMQARANISQGERVNQGLLEALEEISDHAPWGGTKDKYIAWMRGVATAAIAAATKEQT